MNTQQHKPAEWVVVGFDGSPEAASAVRYAVEEARRRRAGVRIAHAMPAFPWGIWPGAIAPEVPTPTGRRLLARAASIAREAAADPEVPVECRLLVGDRRDAIISVAGADAVEIVLGHASESSVLRLGTGSTVIGVAARSPVPVIAVAPDREGAKSQRIAVGVKNPARADEVLRRGLEAAAERDAGLWIIHAWEMPPGYEALASTPEDRELIARRATEQLEGVLGRLATDFPQVEHKISIVHGNPARTLEAASHESDLVLLARREHLLPRGHIGGTARAVLRHAVCPVMIVPALAAVPADPGTPGLQTVYQVETTAGTQVASET